MVLKLQVMIRPRTGSFVYTEDEVQTMLYDIETFKAHGAMGFVFGCLDGDGNVDVERTSRWVRPSVVNLSLLADIRLCQVASGRQGRYH